MKIYKFLLSKSRISLYNLLFYYLFSILFPLMAAEYHEEMIRTMPIVFVLIVIYPLIIVLLLSYLGVKHLINITIDAHLFWEKLLPGKTYIKIINIIKIFKIKSFVAIILATIFYPFYLSIFYYNFIYIVLGLKNEKLLKRRILVPALVSYITAGFSSIFILIIFIIILLFKMKNENEMPSEALNKK